MMLNRRGLLGFALAAPAIIRVPGLLMPVKPLPWTGAIFVSNRVLTDDEVRAFAAGEVVVINPYRSDGMVVTRRLRRLS